MGALQRLRPAVKCRRSHRLRGTLRNHCTNSLSTLFVDRCAYGLRAGGFTGRDLSLNASHRSADALGLTAGHGSADALRLNASHRSVDALRLTAGENSTDALRLTGRHSIPRALRLNHGSSSCTASRRHRCCRDRIRLTPPRRCADFTRGRRRRGGGCRARRRWRRRGELHVIGLRKGCES